MATTFSSYSVPPRTIEVKTGNTGDDATIQSTDGLVVLNAGGGTFSLPTPPSQAQINNARIALQKLPAPSSIPNDGATLDFLNLDGSPDYVINFPDGNVLTFSGTTGEMCSVTVYQGAYSMKSASNGNITFVAGPISANPPTFGSQPAPTQQTAQPT
jgi:hypothetical protein